MSSPSDTFEPAPGTRAQGNSEPDPLERTVNARGIDGARAIDQALALRRHDHQRIVLVSAILFALLLACLYAILVRDTDWARFLSGRSAGSFTRSFGLDLDLLPTLTRPALETVLMATLATGIGLLLALPVALLGARDITPFGHLSYLLARALMSLSRSVHEIVWALLFVSAVGLGALAGVLAMSVRSIGFVSKTLAEAIEDVKPGPIEAIKAAGGSPLQVLLFAIVPQVLPVFAGNLVFEWDINIRRSTVMGLVGAGGLGLALFREMAKFNYGGIATVVLVICALVVAGEWVSHYLRKAVI